MSKLYKRRMAENIVGISFMLVWIDFTSHNHTYPVCFQQIHCSSTIAPEFNALDTGVQGPGTPPGGGQQVHEGLQWSGIWSERCLYVATLGANILDSSSSCRQPFRNSSSVRLPSLFSSILLKMFLALSSAVSVGFTAPAPSMS